MKKTKSKKLTKRPWRNKRAKETRKLLKNSRRKVSAKAIYHL